MGSGTAQYHSLMHSPIQSPGPHARPRARGREGASEVGEGVRSPRGDKNAKHDTVCRAPPRRPRSSTENLGTKGTRPRETHGLRASSPSWEETDSLLLKPCGLGFPPLQPAACRPTSRCPQPATRELSPQKQNNFVNDTRPWCLIPIPH